ncbi:hypothetical protein [Streptococcus pyogenes]|uniref:hypothetical protein n=1 Tax=Streptococcus pyogenes TaxID=1314 RepID=UPI0010A1279F|nr:hypothetical protein [Streptococcus pyogenes]VGV18989.1 Uncharacterised protein [Streptococcus pyogenes]VGV52025.1 Uncharacterised protein [Streptococcus pyogenes]VHA97585.1 Uncharacterised protein [Streptococcus pyogenes]VHB08376.1 Uncharacterised protein [Streptococcus pyogenes]
MKTKSKRFLNLATLCLALLGTTLLMGQPVKAEAVYTNPQSGERLTSVGGPSEDSGSEKTQQTSDDDRRDRNRGYEEGYKRGQESDNRDLDRDTIEVPYNVIDGVEYKDGYEEGFGVGWHDAHPITSFIEMALQFFTSIFDSWFGVGQ